MNLNIEKWKEFKVSDVFSCSTTSALDINESIPGDIPYITRSAFNNGLTGYCGNDENIVKGNCITIGAEGGIAFYQPDDFVPGIKIYTLRHTKLNSTNSMFIVTLLNSSAYLYSYGRARTLKKLKNETIKLPVVNDNTVDWDFMEDYIKSLKHKELTTKNKNSTLLLDVNKWEEFTYSELFELKGGFYNKKPEHSKDGKFPFLASTENNNGVTELYAIEDVQAWDKLGNEDNSLEHKIYKGNCIAVTVNGSVCNAFYQKEDFTCSHDITAFYLKNYKLNSALAMFLCAVIMQDKYRWSYGRKPHNVSKLSKSIIKLPVMRNESGMAIIDSQKMFSKQGFIPDWHFMENYIKELPYSDRI